MVHGANSATGHDGLDPRLQVYKGVVPPGEFSSMVDELVSGPCIAVEVSGYDWLIIEQHSILCQSLDQFYCCCVL